MPKNQTKELCKVVVDFITGFSAGKDISTFLSDVKSREGKEILSNLIRPFFPREKNPLPKKPKTAYGFFTAYAGKKVREKYQGIEQRDVVEKVAKMWAKLDPEKRKKYEKMAAEERKKYDQEKTHVLSKQRPRRPFTSYLFYCQEKRKEVVDANPGFSFGQISCKLGEMWQEEDDKSKWENLAKKAQKEFREKLRLWDEKQKKEEKTAKLVKKLPILGSQF